MTTKSNPRTGNNIFTIGLAVLAGTGFFLMAAALAVGVINGANADGDRIGLLFIGGLLLFVAGLATWLAAVRPWTRFDDINVPRYHGHHHEAGHDAH